MAEPHAAARTKKRSDRCPKQFRAHLRLIPDSTHSAAAASPLHLSAARSKQSAGLRSPEQYYSPPPTPGVPPRWSPLDSRWPESPTPANSAQHRRLWSGETLHKVGHCRTTRMHLDRKSTRLNSSHLVISYAV